jgi:hypothetical protein
MQLRIVPPKPPSNGKPDPLAAALLAAELGESFAYDRLPMTSINELFASLSELRVSVPFATLNLLGHLASDLRADVRAAVAQGLPWFVDLYPDRTEQLLARLAVDGARKVRTAVSEALADLLEWSPTPADLVARWSTFPDRAREVLEAARRLLSATLAQ